METYQSVYKAYDVFGRRQLPLPLGEGWGEGFMRRQDVCDNPCVLDNGIDVCNESHPVYRMCQDQTVMYDYDGLSRNVLVERRGAYRPEVPPAEDPDPLGWHWPAHWMGRGERLANATASALGRFGPFGADSWFDHSSRETPLHWRARLRRCAGFAMGDRFLSTYTYGPTGVVARTAEMDDNDVGNNRDYYYLADAMGGHVGLLAAPSPQGEGGGEGAQASFATYDAFGNRVSLPHTAGASFAWRGAEGSVSDTGVNLVYMQARHYDPELGRFIQPDSLLMARTTTQGMNRYAYAENDPANGSDPTGHFAPAIVAAVLAGVAFFLGLAYGIAVSNSLGGPQSPFDSVLETILAGVTEVGGCNLVLTPLASAIFSDVTAWSLAILGRFVFVFAPIIALAFLAGYIIGRLIGEGVAAAGPRGARSLHPLIVDWTSEGEYASIGSDRTSMLLA